MSARHLTSAEVDSALIVVRRLATSLGPRHTFAAIRIDDQGLTLTVATIEQAQKLATLHPSLHRFSPFTEVWVGAVDEVVPVTVRVDHGQPAPAQVQVPTQRVVTA